jgi:hypothetical protein
VNRPKLRDVKLSTHAPVPVDGGAIELLTQLYAACKLRSSILVGSTLNDWQMTGAFNGANWENAPSHRRSVSTEK